MPSSIRTILLSLPVLAACQEPATAPIHHSENRWSRPTRESRIAYVESNPDLDRRLKGAIRMGRPEIGMTKHQLIRTLGFPESKGEVRREGLTVDAWQYRARYQPVYIVENTVVGWEAPGMRSSRRSVWDTSPLSIESTPRTEAHPTPNADPAPPKLPPETPDQTITILASGSGFLASRQGLVVTAYHVVEDAFVDFFEHDKARSVLIMLEFADEEFYPGMPLHSVPELDLAFLVCVQEIDEEGAPITPLIDSFLSIWSEAQPATGQDIFTIGYPLVSEFGKTQRFQDGAISRHLGDVLEFSMPVFPGNSGGPIVDRQTGALLGLVTSKAADEYFLEKHGVVPQGVGWGLSVSAIQEEYRKRLGLSSIPAEPSPPKFDDAVELVQKSTCLITVFE